VLAAAAHGEKGYGTVLLAARDVGSNARSPLVRLQQPRLGAEENLSTTALYSRRRLCARQ